MASVPASGAPGEEQQVKNVLLGSCGTAKTPLTPSSDRCLAAFDLMPSSVLACYVAVRR
jgi:hypothetical protein